MRKISALLYGFASVLSLFTLLGRPHRRSSVDDANMLASDWRKVGEDIKTSITSFSQINQGYGE